MNLNRIPGSLNISTRQQSGLLLAPGQIINAQVIKAGGSHILLQYGSHLFKARTRLTLKPGLNLKLLVESNKDGLINLKIVDNNDRSGVRLDNAAPWLAGLQPDSNTETITRQLIKFNLPVTPEIITEINRFLRKNNLSADFAQLLIWLKSVGITVDTEQDIRSLQALQRFFQGLLAGDEENIFFNLLNRTENLNLGGLNIYGWPLGRHHVYLLKPGAKSEPVRPDNCQLVIRVDSAALQELWFVVALFENAMTVNIFCTEELFKNILETEADQLRETLQDAGYSVGDLNVKVHKSWATIFDLLPEPEISNVNLQV